ncbi:MAG: hypothetical protein KBB88_01610 [Candidatus Pacebacteria bacterium]|nr:hypothetical protein [Candidatus Paceibacterota bacterium]
MSNSEIIKSFKIAFLSVGIIMLTGQVFATTWYEPTATFPDENAPEPVQTTLLDQEKLGYFASHGLYSFAGGYIQDFLDVGGRVPVDDLSAESDSNTNLLVAGKIGVNMDEYAVPEPLYEMDVWGDIKIRAFSSGVNPGVNYPAPVCVIAEGTIQLCL